MSAMSDIAIEAKEFLRKNYAVDWNVFDDITRAATYELFYGRPHEPGYWNDVEPLQYYNWTGFSTAVKDLRNILYDLPECLYYDGCGFSTSHNVDDDQEFTVFLEVPVATILLNYELEIYI